MKRRQFQIIGWPPHLASTIDEDGGADCTGRRIGRSASLASRCCPPAPWGTTGANLLGCLLLGVLLAKTNDQHAVWPFFAIGFCGSLTTFSGFVFDLWRQGNSVSGLHYLSWNLLGGFALFILAIRLFRPDGP